MFNLMRASELARCITTVKPYVILDGGYSTNHSAGKVIFTKNLPSTSDDHSHCAELVCSMDALHDAVCNRVRHIASRWTINCYYYVDFETFIRQCYGISLGQWNTLNKYRK